MSDSASFMYLLGIIFCFLSIFIYFTIKKRLNAQRNTDKFREKYENWVMRKLEKDQEAVRTEKIRKCPHCQMEISISASRCPYCRSVVGSAFDLFYGDAKRSRASRIKKAYKKDPMQGKHEDDYIASVALKKAIWIGVISYLIICTLLGSIIYG